MDRGSGMYVLAGLALGGVLGLLFAAPSGRAAVGLGIGALAGVFIGWFAAAAVQQVRETSAAEDRERREGAE